MAGSPHVKVSDKGLANFNKAMDELSQLQAEVGLWGESKEDNGARVVDVGFWNEFGTAATPERPAIPSRPFMRRSADTGADIVFAGALTVARQVIAGKSNARGLLDAAARAFKEHVKQTIRDAPRWAKPNALSTQLAKGGKWTDQKGVEHLGTNMPLIDSHLMIATIRHRIRKKGAGK